jgi:hypothetical protein
VSEESVHALTEQQARVLFAVWKEEPSHPKGIPYADIQEAVRKDYPLPVTRGTSVANIKKIVDGLSKWNPPLLRSTRAGKEAKFFRLGKGMVTWPVTAVMLLALDRHGAEKRGVLIERMLKLGLKNAETGTLLTAEDIGENIDYCRSLPSPYISEDARGLLTATDRVASERAYLEKIESFGRPSDRSAASA